MVASLLVSLLLLQPAQTPTQPPSDPAPSIRDGSAQRKLDSARKRWRKADIHNYRFRLTRQCFCPPEDPPVLFVRGDRPLRPPALYRSEATVPRLFRRIQESIDDEVAGLRVRYGRRGVPRFIFINGRDYIADDEVGYKVDRFWRGTRGRGGPEQ